MVDRISKKPGVTPAQTTQVQKKGELKQLKSKTTEFMNKKGGELLGAGKTPTYSNRAQPKEANQVAKAIKRVLPVTGKGRRSK